MKVKNQFLKILVYIPRLIQKLQKLKVFAKQKSSRSLKYTGQNDKRNTFVFTPFFHELNSQI